MSDEPIRYTAAVGAKFFADGSPRAFPGNSIVSDLTSTMAQHALLAGVQEQLRTREFADAFSLLPPPSFHMTVFDLLCEQVREPAHWSSKIPLDAPLEETDRRLANLLAKIPFPGSLSMSFDHFELEKTIGPVLVPADEETKHDLASFRAAAAEATGVRHPNHETYFFHVSLAYLMRELRHRERMAIDAWVGVVDDLLAREFGVLVLHRPRLTFFPDMHSFPTTRP